MSRLLCLEVEGPKVRTGPFISLRDKAIVWGWAQNTVVPNMVLLHLGTIKWRCPPLRRVTCFTPREDLAEPLEQ